MSGMAMGIGTALSTYGSIRAGEQRAKGYELEAKAKEAQAAQVDVAADREIELTERRYQRTKSAQIMAFSRSGVELSGSPLLMLEDDAANAMDEIRTIRQAASYRKSTLKDEAGLSRFMGGEAELSGYLNGASSILTSMSKNPYMFDSGKKDSPISIGGSS